DASLKSISVRDKQVISYQLDLFSQRLGDHAPSFPVVLCEAILNGDNRILLHPIFIQTDHFIASPIESVRFFENIPAVVVEFTRGNVEGERDLRPRLIARLLDR